MRALWASHRSETVKRKKYVICASLSSPAFFFFFFSGREALSYLIPDSTHAQMKSAVMRLHGNLV